MATATLITTDLEFNAEAIDRRVNEVFDRIYKGLPGPSKLYRADAVIQAWSEARQQMDIGMMTPAHRAMVLANARRELEKLKYKPAHMDTTTVKQDLQAKIEVYETVIGALDTAEAA